MAQTLPLLPVRWHFKALVCEIAGWKSHKNFCFKVMGIRIVFVFYHILKLKNPTPARLQALVSRQPVLLMMFHLFGKSGVMICYPISNYAVKSKKLVFPFFSALLLRASLLPAVTSVGVLVGQNIRDSLTFRNIV